jgi:hypothetical protein
MELKFQVKNQRLYLQTVNKVVADSVGYLTAAFSFTDDWNGAVKIAQFTRGTTTTNATLVDNKCTVPTAVLSGEGEFFVSVYGSLNDNSVIVTANAIKIEVVPSGFIAEAGTISQETAAALEAHADAVEAVINNSTTSEGGNARKVEFTVKNQSLYLTTRGRVVADSQGYLGAKFTFTDDWNGTVKVAQFKRGDLFYSILLDSNDECTIPWEVLVDEGEFICNVFGNNTQNSANKIITVNPVTVPVDASGLTAGELPDEPTEGVDGQVLYEIYRYAEEAAASASAAASSATLAQGYAGSAASSAQDLDTAVSSAQESAETASEAASSAASVLEDATELSEQVTELYAEVTEALDMMDDYLPLAGGTLTGTVYGITQTAGDNSTKLATTAYADTAAANAIAELVDQAPETLDTLEELAAALGDDPNFATTVATEIGTKVTAGTSDYIKSASVSGSTLTLTKGNDDIVTFTDTDTTYTAGTNVSIGSGNVISATDTTYTAGTGLSLTNTEFSLDTASANGLGGVKVGTNLSIDNDGVLSATDTTYTAGTNVSITNNAISATDTTYTGSDGITLTGTNFTNSGVRSIATGSTNGTISVNTNGASADVSVKGLGEFAYLNKSAIATGSANGTISVGGSDVSVKGVGSPLVLSDDAATSIPSNADLNTYTTAGTYISRSASRTNSLSNCPVTSVSIKMVVLYIGYGNVDYGQQIIFESNKRIWVRNATTNGNWGNWKHIAYSEDVLPLAGGTLTGNLQIKKDAPEIWLDNSSLTRGTNPSATTTAGTVYFRDNTNSVYTYIAGRVNIDGDGITNIVQRQSNGSSRGVNFLANSTASVFYPGDNNHWLLGDDTHRWKNLYCGSADFNGTVTGVTPASADDSTKFATTEWCNDAFMPIAEGARQIVVNVSSNHGVFTVAAPNNSSYFSCMIAFMSTTGAQFNRIYFVKGYWTGGTSRTKYWMVPTDSDNGNFSVAVDPDNNKVTFTTSTNANIRAVCTVLGEPSGSKMTFTFVAAS